MKQGPPQPPPEVTCELCKALPEPKGALPRDKRITDVNELKHELSRIRVIDRVEVIHHIDAVGMVGRYELSNGEVTCSFPDQRSHGIGRYGYPRCEFAKPKTNRQVVLIGWCCAGKYISGFDAAEKQLKHNEQKTAWRTHIATDPLVSIRLLADAWKLIDAHQLFSRTGEAQRAAFARLARADPREHEYTIPGKKIVAGEVVPDDHVGRLVGLAFWKADHTRHELDDLEAKAYKFQPLAQSQLSDAELEDVYLKVRDLRRRATQLLRWAEAGVAFYAASNYPHAERLARKYVRAA